MVDKTDDKKSDATVHIRRVPKPLKKSFKARCAENGRSMTEEVLRFMEKYVNNQLRKW